MISLGPNGSKDNFMKTAAVIPAFGIGDALLMMIASHQLKLQGYKVTTFHHALPELASWFPDHEMESSYLNLDSFDLIIVENDNSPKIKHLIDTYRSHLSIFYPTYSTQKHAPLHLLDRIFDESRPMADNIAEAMASFFSLPVPSKYNGLTFPTTPPNSKQILIHPTSRVPFKNWKAKGFIKVARKLKKLDFNPVFCVSPQEQSEWQFITNEGFTLVCPPNLSHLATLVHESAAVIGNDSLVGHLASNLDVPTLIIADDEQRMRLWRPGWRQGTLVLPPRHLPDWKLLKSNWQHFVTPNQVLKTFLSSAS